MPHSIIIEGIDRLGKSTLATNLQKLIPNSRNIHLDKPRLTRLDLEQELSDHANLLQYRAAAMYIQYWQNLTKSVDSVIYDRGHLSETVYAPLYRGYNGDYVMGQERTIDASKLTLVLLTTDNFDILVDDGESHNFDNKILEQDSFVTAYILSTITNKCIINVHNGKGGYKTEQEILKEVEKNVLQVK